MVWTTGPLACCDNTSKAARVWHLRVGWYLLLMRQQAVTARAEGPLHSVKQQPPTSSEIPESPEVGVG